MKLRMRKTKMTMLRATEKAMMKTMREQVETKRRKMESTMTLSRSRESQSGKTFWLHSSCSLLSRLWPRLSQSKRRLRCSRRIDWITLISQRAQTDPLLVSITTLTTHSILVGWVMRIQQEIGICPLPWRQGQRFSALRMADSNSIPLGRASPIKWVEEWLRSSSSQIWVRSSSSTNTSRIHNMEWLPILLEDKGLNSRTREESKQGSLTDNSRTSHSLMKSLSCLKTRYPELP